MQTNSPSVFVPQMELADALFTSACQQLGFNPKEELEKLKTGNIQLLILKNMFSLVNQPQSHSHLAGAMAM